MSSTTLAKDTKLISINLSAEECSFLDEFNSQSEIKPHSYTSFHSVPDWGDIYMIAVSAKQLNAQMLLQLKSIRTKIPAPIVLFSDQWDSSIKLELLELNFSDCFDSSLSTQEALVKIKKYLENHQYQTKILKQKNQYIENFSRLHKTINNSLNDIRAVTGTLDQEDLSYKSQSFIKGIASSADQIHNQLKKSLDHYEYSYRNFSDKPQVIDLRGHLAKITENHKRICNEKDISFIIDIAEDIPLHLYFDPKHFDNLIHIFTENAIQNTIDGGILIKLTNSASTDEYCTIEIQINDTGESVHLVKVPGKADDLQPKNSLGLGLLTADKILKKLKSILNIHQNKPSGCRISFSLSFDIASSPESASLLENIYDKDLFNLKVLIIDQQFEKINLFKSLFKQHGQLVDSARSNQDALRILYEQKYDLVIMDTSLPDINDNQLLYQLLTLIKMPVVLLFPERDQTVPFKVFSPLWAAVHKPIKIDSLLSSCSAALNNMIHEDIEIKPYLDATLLRNLKESIPASIFTRILNNFQCSCNHLLELTEKNTASLVQIEPQKLKSFTDNCSYLGFPQLTQEARSLLHCLSTSDLPTQEIIVQNFRDCTQSTLKSIATFETQ